MAALVAWSARHPRLVLAIAVVAALCGELARRSLRRDLIPDLSYPQLAVAIEWPGHPAPEVAASATAVVASVLESVPGVATVRGSSMAGMSYVDVAFHSASALSDGRADIVRRLAGLGDRLPRHARLRVGPDASSVGWVFCYALVGPPAHDPGDAFADPSSGVTMAAIRRHQDRVIGPSLASIPGVAEVATVGGEIEELLVELKPEQLRGAGVALSDVAATLRAAIDGPVMPDAARIASLAVIAPGTAPDAARPPPRIGDLARVRLAGRMGNGTTDVDGQGPAVGGIVVARRDADVPALIAQVKVRLERARAELPAGVRMVVAYDRSELVARVEQNWRRALVEEIAVVVLVVLMFLLHPRSALVPLATLPVVVLLTFAGMWLAGVPATVMSIAGIGIALGLAVDADVVALEACHRRLEATASVVALSAEQRRAQLLAAAGAIAPTILTSLIIGALTFVPVLAFGGETGRLLWPLAFTKTVVVVAAALVSVTLAPALRDRLVTGRIVRELDNPLVRWLVRGYRPVVDFVLRRPLLTLATAALALLSCVPIIPHIGGEFLPRIDEGDLLFMPTTGAGASMADTAGQLTLQDQLIAARPEVAVVFGKVGRADSATDPAPPSMAETIVRLKPRSDWPKQSRARWYSAWAPSVLKPALGLLWPEESEPSSAELVAALDRAARLPGWTNAWTAPARARMDMMSTEVHTPLAIRIVAGRPERLDELAAALRTLARRLPGTVTASYQSSGTDSALRFSADPAALARHGADASLVQATADLLVSGGELGRVAHDGRPVRLRLVPDIVPRAPEQWLREASVRAPSASDGQPVALGLLGRPLTAAYPAMVLTERGRYYAYLYIDVAEGTDLLGYVERAERAFTEASAAGPPLLRDGEELQWTGQYRPLVAGQRRLAVVVPLVVLAMVALLLLQFRSVVESLIVLASVPFALVGSMWTLFLLGYRFSAPVWVGLLSILALAMQTGVVMVVYIDEAFYRRLRDGRIASRDDIVAAHAEGTIRRLRPKLMTIAMMAAGLLPLLWSRGTGAEIMRRVAAPMAGGLASSAFLTLEVIPVLYTIWRQRQLRRAQRLGVPLEAIVGKPPRWARS